MNEIQNIQNSLTRVISRVEEGLGLLYKNVLEGLKTNQKKTFEVAEAKRGHT